MGTDLSARQRPEHEDQGKITGVDGRGYSRRGTKSKRSVADELVTSGAPLVLDMYSSGQFEWFEGEDARKTWAEVRPYVISARPTSKQLGKHEMWNAGIWEDEDGNQLLYLTVPADPRTSGSAALWAATLARICRDWCSSLRTAQRTRMLLREELADSPKYEFPEKCHRQEGGQDDRERLKAPDGCENRWMRAAHSERTGDSHGSREGEDSSRDQDFQSC
jgi:hypothetical protein